MSNIELVEVAVMESFKASTDETTYNDQFSLVALERVATYLEASSYEPDEIRSDPKAIALVQQLFDFFAFIVTNWEEE